MKKQQVFYIHGGSSYSDQEDFLETLRSCEIRNLPGQEPLKKWAGTIVEDLGEEFEVFKPSMPNADNAKYDEWKIWFERHFEYVRDGVVLVGWSLGGMFLVKYLIENELPFRVQALFLVAAPFEPFVEEKEDCAEFGFDTAHVNQLTEKVGNLFLFHSKDDPIVSYEHALKYKELLPAAELVTFADKNHFLIQEFPELVQKIKEVSGVGVKPRCLYKRVDPEVYKKYRGY
jgi:predicted alpha/beta hydrolase family esterase